MTSFVFCFFLLAEVRKGIDYLTYLTLLTYVAEPYGNVSRLLSLMQV